MDPDLRLIQKMKMGNVQAIDLFVQKYYPRILKYCRLHISDYGYAEDMTQETFERFFRNFHQYQHYGKAVNYLYVIAGNCCRDHLRKKSEVVTDRLPESPDESMAHIEDWIDVHMALDRLPGELKEVAILYFFQELKQREIAQILGIGVPLVKYRIRRAKAFFSDCLEKEGKA